MNCYYHQKIAVGSCSKCQIALCDDCYDRFPQKICWSCAEDERRKLVEEDQNFVKFIKWAIPLGGIAGLLIGLVFFRQNLKWFLVVMSYGIFLPTFLRRIYVLERRRNPLMPFSGCAWIGSMVIGLIGGVYAYKLGWLYLVIEVILYFMRKKKIQDFNEKL